MIDLTNPDNLVNPKYADYHKRNAASDALAVEALAEGVTFLAKPVYLPEDAKWWQLNRLQANPMPLSMLISLIVLSEIGICIYHVLKDAFPVIHG